MGQASQRIANGASDTIRRVARDFRQVVMVNNQNSMLMSMVVSQSGKDLLCLLHDNRIFAFSGGEYANLREIAASSSSQEQNLILNMLTTPKYRLLGALYIIFRLMDNLTFLTIIVLSIYHGTLTFPSNSDYALVSTIGLEIFYNVIMQTNKYWILQRLSFFIAILLYGAYFTIVLVKNHLGTFKDDQFKIVFGVLCARLISFILEEGVDVVLDASIHNDLTKLQSEKRDIEMQRGASGEGDDEHDSGSGESGSGESRSSESGETTKLIHKNKSFCGSSYWFNVSRVVNMPAKITYEGSFFAWSARSVFSEDVKIWRKDTISKWMLIPLCLLQLMVASFFGIVLMIVCIVALLIPIGISYLIFCCCCCSTRFWRTPEVRNLLSEITHS